MADFGLSVRALYSTLSDRELDCLVLEIKGDFPNCGSRLLLGHLLSREHSLSKSYLRIIALC